MRFVLTIIFVACLGQLHGQNSLMPVDDTVFVYGYASDFDILENTFTVNTGTTDITVNWHREVVSLPSGWNVSNCFINCFGPTIDSGQANIATGDSAYTNTHFYPNGISGTGIVKIVVEEEGNPSNTTEVVFVCEASINPLAIQAPERENFIAVYPNPVQSSLHIRTTRNDLQTIRVYDTMGKLVMEMDTQQSPQWMIDVRNLKKGLYLIHAETNSNGVLRSSFVKQ